MDEYTLENGWISRPFGRDQLYTKRIERVPHDKLIPNAEQPRQGEWESDELMRQIYEGNGVFEPLLVEPHPEGHGMYIIIDGHRRWTNVGRILQDLERRQKDFPSLEEWQAEHNKFALLNIEVTHKHLSVQERLRIWVHIHRQRKEWSLREREMTAFKLLEHMTKVDAAATIGVSLRELDKLVETYETAKGLESVLPSPESAITWARELVNVSPKFRTPQVVDELKNKVEKGLVVNSKDVRALRNITPNPKALAKFLEPDASVEDALAFTSKANNKNKATQQKQPEVADDKFGSNLTSDLLNFSDTVRGYSWSELAQLLEDPDFRKAFTEAKAAISQLETLVKM